MRTLNSLNAGTAEKRSAIIAAALDCFVDLGFTQSTMEKIRARACVSNGSLYHHFKSKEELAAAVYLDGIIDYQKGIVKIVGRNPAAEQGIKSTVKYHLNWVARNESRAKFLFWMRRSELTEEAGGALAEANGRFAKQFAEWLNARRRTGEIGDMPGVVCVTLILGPCQEFSRIWLAGETKVGISKAAADIGNGVWNAIKA